MSTIVLLDTGLLGLLTNPKASLEADQCGQWLLSLSMKGFEAKVPEIADYEIRRELLRMDKIDSIKRLDDLKNVLGSVPITTQVMLVAAEFWAYARKQGKPTADNKALDGAHDAQRDCVAEEYMKETGEREKMSKSRGSFRQSQWVA